MLKSDEYSALQSPSGRNPSAHSEGLNLLDSETKTYTVQEGNNIVISPSSGML